MTATLLLGSYPPHLSCSRLHAAIHSHGLTACTGASAQAYAGTYAVEFFNGGAEAAHTDMLTLASTTLVSTIPAP